MKVSIILVNYNGGDILLQCIQSLVGHIRSVAYEIIVVDNASTDGGVETLGQKWPTVRIAVNRLNVGFAKGCNAGARLAEGQYLLFLNPDTVFMTDALGPLVEYLESHRQYGVVGPRLVNEDGSFQLSCGRLPSVWREAVDKSIYAMSRRKVRWIVRAVERRYRDNQDVEWVTGACLLIRKDLFWQIGGFDEKMFMYFEDKELCKRVRETGSRVAYFPRVTVVHKLGKASGDGGGDVRERAYRSSQIHYYKKHLGTVQTLLLKTYYTLTGKEYQEDAA